MRQSRIYIGLGVLGQAVAVCALYLGLNSPTIAESADARLLFLSFAALLASTSGVLLCTSTDGGAQ